MEFIDIKVIKINLDVDDSIKATYNARSLGRNDVAAKGDIGSTTCIDPLGVRRGEIKIYFIGKVFGRIDKLVILA